MFFTQVGCVRTTNIYEEMIMDYFEQSIDDQEFYGKFKSNMYACSRSYYYKSYLMAKQAGETARKRVEESLRTSQGFRWGTVSTEKSSMGVQSQIIQKNGKDVI